MSELTNTEKKIQRKAGRVPRILRKQAIKLLTFLYKDKINNEKADELKVPYAQGFSIGVEDSETNLAAREAVKDILYTKYNKNNDKILHDYFINNKANGIHKWFSYFDVYERHFSRFRGKDVNILEIGVQNGGSARMWKHYFTHNGAKVNIYGVDIDKRCKNFEDDGIQIFIGSQEDREFWQKIKKQIPNVDILIDDGGHTMRQQIITFEEMYDFVKEDGVYLCEDLHTSYWKSFGGGYAKTGGGGAIPHSLNIPNILLML